MTRHDDPDTTSTETTTGHAFSHTTGKCVNCGTPHRDTDWAERCPALDTTAPIDTTTGQAPVVSTPAELDALPVGSVVLDRQGTSWQKTDDTHWQGVGDRSYWWPEGVMAEHTGPVTILRVPGRDLLAEARAEVAELREQRNQATLALAEAPGFMSVWREAEARGVERARVDLAAQVAQAEATLIAEAEARGVARGRREALLSAADAYTNYEGDRGEAMVVRRWLRARAGETPGGAA